MSTQNAVVVADRITRNRAISSAVAAAYFLGIQFIVHPVLRSDGWGQTGWRPYAWAFNSALLLLLLLPLGGWVKGPRVRELVNDELSRAHARTGMCVGFWLAMLVGLTLYVLPQGRTFAARDAAYLIVTPATGIALLVFALLEWRALRNG